MISRRALSLLIILAVAGPALAVDVPASVKCDEFKPESREYLLSRHNPSPPNTGYEDVGGIRIQLPAQTQTLFRGIVDSNQQFNIEKVLAGIFKEKDWYLGSPMFWGIQNILMGRKSLSESFIPVGGLPLAMDAYLNKRGLLDDVRTLLQCRRGGTYSLSEAEHLSAILMNKFFFQKSSDLNEWYFNINNREYYASSYEDIGLGNNAVDFIIGTPYDQVAAYYGMKTLVFKDTRNRGLDLGYFNWVNNRKWWDLWVDNGEINVPGYLTSDEVIGLQIRKKDRDRRRGPVLPNSEIDWAYYKADVEGQPVVLVLDASSNLCVVHGSDQRLYPCAQDDWTRYTTQPVSYPAPQRNDLSKSQRVPLVAVISNCTDADCVIANKAAAWYEKLSTRRLDSTTVARIERLTINGAKLRFITEFKPVAGGAAPAPAPAAPVEDLNFKGIKVLSATYLPSAEINARTMGNVTAPAAAYCKDKEEVAYVVANRFLGLPASTDEKEFRMQWQCPNGKKFERTVAAPAEGKRFYVSCKGQTP